MHNQCMTPTWYRPHSMLWDGNEHCESDKLRNNCIVEPCQRAQQSSAGCYNEATTHDEPFKGDPKVSWHQLLYNDKRGPTILPTQKGQKSWGQKTAKTVTGYAKPTRTKRPEHSVEWGLYHVGVTAWMECYFMLVLWMDYGWFMTITPAVSHFFISCGIL